MWWYLLILLLSPVLSRKRSSVVLSAFNDTTQDRQVPVSFNNFRFFNDTHPCSLPPPFQYKQFYSCRANGKGFQMSSSSQPIPDGYVITKITLNIHAVGWYKLNASNTDASLIVAINKPKMGPYIILASPFPQCQVDVEINLWDSVDPFFENWYYGSEGVNNLSLKVLAQDNSTQICVSDPVVFIFSLTSVDPDFMGVEPTNFTLESNATEITVLSRAVGSYQYDCIFERLVDGKSEQKIVPYVAPLSTGNETAEEGTASRGSCNLPSDFMKVPGLVNISMTFTGMAGVHYVTPKTSFLVYDALQLTGVSPLYIPINTPSLKLQVSAVIPRNYTIPTYKFFCAFTQSDITKEHPYIPAGGNTGLCPIPEEMLKIASIVFFSLRCSNPGIVFQPELVMLTIFDQPKADSVVPLKGDVKGGEMITIGGYGFLPTGAIQLSFGSPTSPLPLITNATFINSTTITCRSPKKADGVPQLLPIFYTMTGLVNTWKPLNYTFNYTSSPTPITPPTPTPTHTPTPTPTPTPTHTPTPTPTPTPHPAPAPVPEQPAPVPDTFQKNIVPFSIFIALGLFLGASLVGYFFCCRKKKGNGSGGFPFDPINTPDGGGGVGGSPLHIKWSDISIREKIGRGSFADVYLGEWKHTLVAVKKLSEAKLTEGEEEFANEARLMLSLRHPNVVNFMGTCTAPLCIITEYLVRGSLHDILRDTSYNLDKEDVRRFALDCCKGMTYLHNCKVLHRDLKSRNLLIDDYWNMKVADFGLSRFVADDIAHTFTSCGTPAWAAPELLRGQQYSFEADVYSFAVVLYEMATGEEPFKGVPPTTVVLLVAMQGKRPQMPNDVPPEFQKLIQECWSEQPTKRPTFNTLVEALKGCRFDTTSTHVHNITNLPYRPSTRTTRQLIEDSNGNLGKNNNDSASTTTTSSSSTTSSDESTDSFLRDSTDGRPNIQNKRRDRGGTGMENRDSTPKVGTSYVDPYSSTPAGAKKGGSSGAHNRQTL